MKKAILLLFILSAAFAQVPEYHLAPGWNLIGGSDSPFSASAIDTIDAIVPPIYIFNSSTSGYSEADTIRPLYGYWIMSRESLIVGRVIDTLPPPATVTDIDGNEYETIVIGDQCWMAENLKVTHYRDGTPIEHLILDRDWGNVDIADSGAYCNYDNDSSNVETYGRLYNWYAVDNPHGLCPEGWHVPSEEEWQQLELHLGIDPLLIDSLGPRGTNEGSQLAGEASLWSAGALKEDSAFGTSGFDAIASGTRSYSGPYSNIYRSAGFWALTDFTTYSAWFRTTSNYETRIIHNYGSKLYGICVRCMMD